MVLDILLDVGGGVSVCGKDHVLVPLVAEVQCDGDCWGGLSAIELYKHSPSPSSYTYVDPRD